MSSSAAVGPSSECFFVGRNELLSWVNGLLGLNLTKVEAVRLALAHARST
jgi:hypothetical protein